MTSTDERRRRATQKLVQYLGEAHASEQGLTRVLQSQIAMTPPGGYRTALERHLKETRSHAERVERRLSELDGGRNPVAAGVALAEDVVAQLLALGKTPIDLLRGTGGEEKVLKNAKDACATEALEIATYTTIEHLAREVGDTRTAQLAASIRADEEAMLERVLTELRTLTAAVAGAEIDGNPSYDVRETGAAQAVRGATVRAVGEIPIARYAALTVADITGRLPGLSQADLEAVAAYERANENRAAVLDRIEGLRGDEPWPGYDDLNVGRIRVVLENADDARRAQVLAYERAHKNRAGVIAAARPEPVTA